MSEQLSPTELDFELSKGSGCALKECPQAERGKSNPISPRTLKAVSFELKAAKLSILIMADYGRRGIWV